VTAQLGPPLQSVSRDWVRSAKKSVIPVNLNLQKCIFCEYMQLKQLILVSFRLIATSASALQHDLDKSNLVPRIVRSAWWPWNPSLWWRRRNRFKPPDDEQLLSNRAI
jgi:hypothetical protein